MRQRSKLALICLFVLGNVAISGQALATATLLPPGENCFQAQAGVNGMVGTIGALTGGSGGTAGTYAGVALTGGSGSGATANITVAGGAVTAVTILNPGITYVTGDVLSAASGTIGGVTGFSVPVASTSINSSLAGGSVAFYVPNTASFKDTWFNADQTAAHKNNNPVALDQNGCAIIYGTGSYRQILKDSLGNTVWDQVTADTSSYNSVFWAGLAGGTPNVIVVTDAGFNGTDGSIINFTAIATNTGPATLNPSSYGAISILKDTTGGPVSLTGGEIVQTNPVSVIYRASDSAFHILNPPIQSASGSTAPLCGATGYKVQNTPAFPNTEMDVSLSTGVAVAPTGAIINRSSIAFTINFAVNGANGLDAGAIAAFQFYYIWLIDNGAASAGLASLSSTTPTMPAGYSYKCRLSTVVTDASAHLINIITLGALTSVTGDPAGFVDQAVTGTCNSSFTAVPWANQLPPTATWAIGHVNINGATNAGVAGQSANGPLISGVTPGVAGGFWAIYFQVPLQIPQTFYYCSNSAANSVRLTGWIDNTNAH